jgi:hypothetical protein
LIAGDSKLAEEDFRRGLGSRENLGAGDREFRELTWRSII